jgi:hypothetical protein
MARCGNTVRSATGRPIRQPGRRRTFAAPALVGRIVAIGASVFALHIAGQGVLAVPAIEGPAALRAWAESTPPVDVTFSGLRVAAMAVGLYLLVVVGLALLGEVVGREPYRALARRLVPTSGHGWLALTAGASILGGAMAMAPPAGALPPSPSAGGLDVGASAPPRLIRAGPGALPTAATPSTAGATGPSIVPPTLRLIGPAGGTGTPRPPLSDAPSSATSPTTSPPTPPPMTTRRSARPAHGAQKAATEQHESTPRRPVTDRHDHGRRRQPDAGTVVVFTRVVQPGDSFWSIATAELQTGLGRPPTNGEIAAYWTRLIAANEERLPVPGNPNVLFPGDRLRLPPP